MSTLDETTSNSANHEDRKVNCHKLYIDGELYAIVHTYNDALYLLAVLDSSGETIKTHAIKAANIPGIEF